VTTAAPATTDDSAALLPATDLVAPQPLASLVAPRTLELLARRRRPALIRHRRWLIRWALLAADVVGLCVAFGLAELLYGSRDGSFDRVSLYGEVIVFLGCLPVFVLVARGQGLYARDETRARHSTVEEISGVFQLVTIGAWLLVAFGSLFGHARPNLPKVILFWGLAVTLVSLARAVARACARRQPAYVQNTLIVGAGAVGQVVAQKFAHHPEYGVNVVGFVDSAPPESAATSEAGLVLGGPEELPSLVEQLDIERIVLAFSSDSYVRMNELLRLLRDFDVQIDIVPRLFEAVSYGRAEISDVEGLPLIGLAPLRLSWISLLLKRLTDIVLAGVGVVVLAPFLALIALAVTVETPGPVLFRQRRIGAGGREFTILKFRTMVADAERQKAALQHLNSHAGSGDPRLFKIVDDPRLTRVGRALRRFSLDELPQLVNVLRGEMSLVGPRPLVLDEHDHVQEWALKRSALKPGITGLWQVLGRDAIPFGEMVRLDYLYVTGWSLYGDLKILLATLPEVIRGRDGH
jgi:exopolysaccharide biosynthesis polyprenyl glycosylphosphotransferase